MLDRTITHFCIHYHPVMHTRDDIEQLCKHYATELLSIESEPKKKYNREVKVTIKCCVAGCIGTVTKTIRNHFLTKNFGCEKHALSITNQKTIASKQQNSRDRVRYFEGKKKEHQSHVIPNSQENEVICDSDVTSEKGTHKSKMLDATDLTQELKNNFFKKHRFFEYDERRWTKANDVARFLEYLDAANMIYHHVAEKDKLSFKNFPQNIQMKIKVLYGAVSTIQAQTMFINENGITKLINRSHKPVATGQKRKIEEVYVATSSLYEKQNVYKIGKSVNSKKRIETMNTSRHPDDEMYLCHVATCNDALKYEQLIHDQLEKYRVVPNREFFQVSLEKIISVVNDVCDKSK